MRSSEVDYPEILERGRSGRGVLKELCVAIEVSLGIDLEIRVVSLQSFARLGFTIGHVATTILSVGSSEPTDIIEIQSWRFGSCVRATEPMLARNFVYASVDVISADGSASVVEMV